MAGVVCRSGVLLRWAVDVCVYDLCKRGQRVVGFRGCVEGVWRVGWGRLLLRVCCRVSRVGLVGQDYCGYGCCRVEMVRGRRDRWWGRVSAGARGVGVPKVSGNCLTGIQVLAGTSLTMRNSVVSNNTGTNGGGLRINGTATITDSTIRTNAATGGGGGINLQDAGTLTLTRSTISGNTAGGGLRISKASATHGNGDADQRHDQRQQQRGCRGQRDHGRRE